jgi:hypothetical protein
MKHLILAAALLGFTATTSMAQVSGWPAPPTATEVQALKADLLAKKTSFAANIAGNHKSKAEADAKSLMQMMSRHVVETRNTAENASNTTIRNTTMQHMVELEAFYAAFQRKANNVMGNGAELVQAADDYYNHF